MKTVIYFKMSKWYKGKRKIMEISYIIRYL